LQFSGAPFAFAFARDPLMDYGPGSPMKKCLMVLTGLFAFCLCANAGPVVALDTSLGRITIELHEDKPVTVANFLSYINSGSFTNSFAHRLLPGFVLQGGGFALQGATITSVPTSAPIINEYNVGQTRSNVLGTLAMAKVGNNPDSATSQWFLNLADNSADLDTQTGGFTVFGDVMDGMDVLTLFNTTFSDPQANGGRGVYNASAYLGSDAFTNMPLLFGQLTTNDLVYTTWSVVPEPGSVGLMAAAGLALLVLKSPKQGA
jgi:cyclophilin family peptidyl-prolyl cis-trans isomerase